VKVERPPGEARIDVGVDGRGEFFAVRVPENAETVAVVDADRDERCLLLLVRDGRMKSKFLCGFDERPWFVAAIPESARSVRGIVAAKDALQPQAVREGSLECGLAIASVAATPPTSARVSGFSCRSRRSRWTSVACCGTSR
jgi:hypothetical protein